MVLPELNYAKEGSGIDLNQVADQIQRTNYNRAIMDQMKQAQADKQKEMKMNEQHQGVSNYLSTRKSYYDELMKSGDQALIDQAVASDKAYLGQNFKDVAADYEGMQFKVANKKWQNEFTVDAKTAENLNKLHPGASYVPGQRLVRDQDGNIQDVTDTWNKSQAELLKTQAETNRLNRWAANYGDKKTMTPEQLIKAMSQMRYNEDTQGMEDLASLHPNLFNADGSVKTKTTPPPKDAPKVKYEVGKTYKDAKGNKGIYQKDGTFKKVK